MKILRHRLHHDDGTPYEWRPSPNRGGRLEPEYLVTHYTAGRSLDESVDWLTNRQSRASAHVVIGRDRTTCNWSRSTPSPGTRAPAAGRAARG